MTAPQNKDNPDRQGSSGGNSPGESGPGITPFNLIFGLILIFFVILLLSQFFSQRSKYIQVSNSYFSKLLEGVDAEGKPIKDKDGKQVGNKINGKLVPCVIRAVNVRGRKCEAVCYVAPPSEPIVDPAKTIWGTQKATELGKYIYVTLDQGDFENANFEKYLKSRGVVYKKLQVENSGQMTQMLFIIGITVLMLGFMWWMLRRSQGQMFGGGGFLNNFSRSTAKRYDGEDQQITFDDVAGADGVKSELEEVVDFLKNPEKYQKLGGRIPRGILLNGPPGTGKTLLARAVAGEAEVPYYSVNGSEFIQMFVGVGASRVRDLFQNAKSNAPAIIFVDEIDAVGRQRGAGLGGGHDEREQTLNQILSEMDGFGGSDSVIVLAATNRPDVLDPALLRPGRFDRHVTVNRPTRDGREAIFKVHVKNVPLSDDVDLRLLASSTTGMTGADIRNVVNEAALHAARNDKSMVGKKDFSFALDRVRMGPRREEVLSDDNKEKTAYHEAGHTLAAWLLPKANPVSKVTVIPRGQSLGQTFMVPPEDRLDYAKTDMEQLLVVMLAGRAAEQIIYEEASAGAQQDLEQATGLARRMVTQWGMSQRLGPVSFKMSDEDPFLGREMHQSRQFSEHTLEVIDEEITLILSAASEHAKKLLTENADKMEAITRGLVEHEELDRIELEKLIGPAAQVLSQPIDNGNGVLDSEEESNDEKAESGSSEEQPKFEPEEESTESSD